MQYCLQPRRVIDALFDGKFQELALAGVVVDERAGLAVVHGQALLHHGLRVVLPRHQARHAVATVAVARLGQQRRHVEVALPDVSHVVAAAAVGAHASRQQLGRQYMLRQRDVHHRVHLLHTGGAGEATYVYAARLRVQYEVTLPVLSLDLGPVELCADSHPAARSSSIKDMKCSRTCKHAHQKPAVLGVGLGQALFHHLRHQGVGDELASAGVRLQLLSIGALLLDLGSYDIAS